MSETQQKQEGVIACDMKVFTPEELAQHTATVNTLFGSTLEVRHLPDGFILRLPSDSSMLMLAAEFVRNERRCCAFETFDIRVEPYASAIWLSLTGPEGYREAIFGDLGRLLNPQVAEAAGLR